MPVLKELILYTVMSTLLGFMGWNSGQSTHKTLLFEIPQVLIHSQSISDTDVKNQTCDVFVCNVVNRECYQYFPLPLQERQKITEAKKNMSLTPKCFFIFCLIFVFFS